MNLMLNVLGTCIVGCAALGTLAACSTDPVSTWANANRGALLREFYNDERVLTLEDIKLETSLFQAETHN